MEGEGEFTGEDAYHQFGQLANVFYETGPGLPDPPPVADGQRLFRLPAPGAGAPADYVRYSFTFWEDVDYYSGQVKVVSGSSASCQLLSRPSGYLANRTQVLLKLINPPLFDFRRRHYAPPSTLSPVYVTCTEINPKTVFM